MSGVLRGSVGHKLELTNAMFLDATFAKKSSKVQLSEKKRKKKPWKEKATHWQTRKPIAFLCGAHQLIFGCGVVPPESYFG